MSTSFAPKDKFSLLLPTYNERENLPIMVFLINEQFEAMDEEYEILVIDDGSPDGTQDVARELQDIYGDDKVVLHCREGKQGLGSAYKFGLEHCTGNFVIILDADMSHHPKFIKQFIAKQRKGDCDIVSGTRYMANGGVFGWNFMRKLTSKVANVIAQELLAPKASDLTGSFRLYKKSVLDSIISQVGSLGYSFQMEVIVRAGKSGFSIEEVPISFVDRVYGESKIDSGEIVKYLEALLWMFWEL
eukprot:TRINITY_DN928_c2_g1_i1.p1 TRINITY_DN928_c2_g1~~TRINITY_DN928_c2_g1_i1.p1  ORF type:complete len:245 (-),score=64.05 TRINITY_DN928_c2_g1_i1:55-789(-)